MAESDCKLTQPRLHHGHVIERDEINPDTLIVAFSEAIAALEAAAEEDGTAMNWESIQVGLTFPAFPEKSGRPPYAIVNAAVRRLPQ